MRRDNIPEFSSRRFSVNASAGFIDLTEAVAKGVEPTATQIAELDRAYNATGEFLIDCSDFDGLVTQVHAHGSRQLGTIVRPLDAQDEGFDIDLIMRLSTGALNRYGGEKGAGLLLDHTFGALRRYADRHGLAIKKWERCVTLVYSGGMRADFAPVIEDPAFGLLHGEHHGLIPDRDLKRYISTNPKGYSLGFDEAAKVTPVFRSAEAIAKSITADRADLAPLPDAPDVLGRLLSRFVQLTKVHRNHAFAQLTNPKSLAPTSVFLTSLIAKAYVLLAPRPHDGPLDLFLDIVELMPHLFTREPQAGGRERWYLENPYARADNLAESMNTSLRQQAFWQWHARLREDLDSLLGAIEAGQGVDIVANAVEMSFGPRAREAFIRQGAQRRESRRSLGQASFIVAGSMPVVARAQSHTYYGDQPR